MKNTTLILLFSLLSISSCTRDPSAELKKNTLNTIEKWYYSSSPTYESEGKRRTDEKKYSNLEDALKIRHQIDNSYELRSEDINYNFINSDEVIITLNYIFSHNDANIIYSDTFYYDGDNTPTPIPLKIHSLLGGNFEYSIIEKH